MSALVRVTWRRRSSGHTSYSAYALLIGADKFWCSDRCLAVWPSFGLYSLLQPMLASLSSLQNIHGGHEWGCIMGVCWVFWHWRPLHQIWNTHTVTCRNRSSSPVLILALFTHQKKHNTCDSCNSTGGRFICNLSVKLDAICNLHVSSLFVKQAPGLHLNRVWYFLFFFYPLFLDSGNRIDWAGWQSFHVILQT